MSVSDGIQVNFAVVATSVETHAHMFCLTSPFSGATVG